MIQEYYNLTNCTMILNTSLNVEGEPIAGHIDQAIQLFKNTTLDCLVVGNTFMIK